MALVGRYRDLVQEAGLADRGERPPVRRRGAPCLVGALGRTHHQRVVERHHVSWRSTPCSGTQHRPSGRARWSATRTAACCAEARHAVGESRGRACRGSLAQPLDACRAVPVASTPLTTGSGASAAGAAIAARQRPPCWQACAWARRACWTKGAAAARLATLAAWRRYAICLGSALRRRHGSNEVLVLDPICTPFAMLPTVVLRCRTRTTAEAPRRPVSNRMRIPRLDAERAQSPVHRYAGGQGRSCGSQRRRRSIAERAPHVHAPAPSGADPSRTRRCRG